MTRTRATEARGERADADRVDRVLALFLATGALFYAVALLPAIIAQADVSRWWTTVAVIGCAGPMVAMAAAARWTDIRTLRVSAAVAAVSYLTVSILWWRVAEQFREAGIERPWHTNVPGLFVLATALIGRRILPWAYLAVTSIPVALAYEFCEHPLTVANALNAVAYLASVLCLFMFFMVSARNVVRILDAEAVERTEQAVAASSVRVRGREAERIGALIHDHVLALLLAAGGGVRSDFSAEADKVRAVLRRSATPLEDAELAVGDAVAELTARVAAVCPEAAVVIEDPRSIPGDRDGGPPGRGRAGAAGTGHVPAHVVEAVGAAMSEALRNAAEHAGGGPANRGGNGEPSRRPIIRVRIGVRGGLVRVEVADTGVGFRPETVPAGRMGIQVSIRGRMAEIPGGWTRIRSVPGRGTTIALGWQDPVGRSLREERDIDRLIGIRSRRLTAILAVCAVQWIHLPLSAAGSMHLAVTIPAYVVVVAVFIVISLNVPVDPLPRTATLAILAVAWAAGVVFPLAHFAGEWAGTDGWWVILIADFLLILAGRGEVAVALAAFAGMALLFVMTAAITDGGDVLPAVLRGLSWGLPLVLIGSVYGFVIRGAVRRLRRVRAEAARDEVTLANAAAAATERVRTLDAVHALIDPMLERLRTGVPLDEEERRRCLLLEAHIRDGLRSPALAGEVATAAWEARIRGVDVVLLDDSALVSRIGEPVDDAAASAVARVREAALDVLGRATGGRVTVRVHPPGRSKVATIVVVAEDGDVTRVEIPVADARLSIAGPTS